jgi:hypothetical protein
MPETFQNQESQENKSKISPLTIGIAVAVVAAILLSLWFLFEPLKSRKRATLTETLDLTMNSAEQEYSKKIEIGNITLSRAENFLHQEVTTLTSEVHNAGTEPVTGLRLTAEFSDEMNQVVLRESRKVLGTPEVALAPGERRAFEISFEHIPDAWNMQAPAIRVSYLQLPSRKQ